MPYDPNSDMGLSALSPTLSAYKQYVANNGSGKTAAEVLAQQGNAALAMLALKQDYLQNVADLQTKLAQQPQAAPPTVSEDFDAAIAQQDQQTQQALMAQMPQPVPGLPGMPNPAMDRANFAGGGIVAFADGGDVQRFAIGGLTSEEEAEFNALQNQQRQYNQLVGRGGIASVAGSPMQRDIGATRNRLQQLQSKIDAYATQVAYNRNRAYPGISAPTAPAAAPTSPAPAAAPTPPAAPAATTKPNAGILAAANAATRDTNAGKAAAKAAPTVAAAAPKPTAPAAARPVDLYAKYIEEAGKEAKGEKALTQEALDRYKTLGIGKAADDLEKVISNLRAEYEGPGADKKNLKQSIIEASARMMMGKGGFAEALGEAVGTGVTGYYGRKDKMKDAALGLAKNTYELNQAKENLMLSAAKEGSAEYEKQKQRIQDLRDAQLKSQDAWNKTTYEQQQLNARLASENAAAQRRAEIMYGTREDATTTAQFTAQVNKLKAIAASASDVMKTAGLSDPVAYAAAKKRYDDAMNSLSAMQFGGGGGGAGGVTSSGW